mmetsp:Transcript_126129/g.315230  ORF Transcript_126129/g.315230 Transcript_126129/m.315230 type:complete len:80 (+) Transcript_126129:424-663(+)
MEKVDVNGQQKSPVYQFLRQTAGDGDIRWNFNTKFIVHCHDNEGTCEITRHDGGFVTSAQALRSAQPKKIDLNQMRSEL